MKERTIFDEEEVLWLQSRRFEVQAVIDELASEGLIPYWPIVTSATFDVDEHAIRFEFGFAPLHAIKIQWQEGASFRNLVSAGVLEQVRALTRNERADETGNDVPAH